jgi:tetratricopeptide (TPR) repeat protein
MAVAPAPQPIRVILHTCAEIPDVIGIVGSLIDKSLVVQRTSAAAEPRLAMLDLVRRFAVDQLQDSGEAHQVARLFAEYWANLGDTIEPGLWSTETDRIFRSLSDQVSNLEAALEWSFEHDPMIGAHIAGGFLYFFVRSASSGTVKRWLDAALAVEDLPPTIEARIWIAKAYYAWGTVTRHEHSEAVDRAADAARRSGEERHIVTSEMLRAVEAVGVPEAYETASNRARSAAERALELGLPVLAAQGLNIVGELARNLDDLDTAQRVYEEVLDLIAPFGDQLRQRMILANLSFVARRRGDYPHALRLALETAQAASASVINEATLIAASRPLLELGRPTSACILYGAALANLDQLGIGWQPSDAPEAEALEARLDESLSAVQKSHLIAAGRRLGPVEAIAFALSEASELLGDPDQADVTSTSASAPNEATPG